MKIVDITPCYRITLENGSYGMETYIDADSKLQITFEDGMGALVCMASVIVLLTLAAKYLGVEKKTALFMGVVNIIPLGSHQFPASEPSGNGIFHLQSHHNILWRRTYLISL